MANITTPADFIGQNNVPDKDLISENLTWFINKYEPVTPDFVEIDGSAMFTVTPVGFLPKVLGIDLYSVYVIDPSVERFAKLVEPFLKPACVDYTYWFYLEDQYIQLTSMGASQAKKQNAKTVSPYPKMVRAWNEMVEINRRLHKFLTDNASTYPEYKVCLPNWFFGYQFYCGIWQSWFFNWCDWSGEYGACVDEIYRFKNTLI